MATQPIETRPLTPETLEHLVLHEEARTLAGAFAELNEKERKALSKTASNLYRVIRRRGLGQRVGDALKGLMERAATGKSRSLDVNAQLALLAACPASVVKRMVLWYMKPSHQKLMVKILLDRRPSWLQEWIEHRLDQEFQGISWESIRTLVREGACEKPQSDGYLRLMAQHFIVWADRDRKTVYPPLSQRLLEQPEVLDDVYRLFDVETVAFTANYFANNPTLPEDYETWTEAVVSLSESGRLDRDRLLDASLAGLTTGHKANLLSGFRKVHERLAPTLEEIEARQGNYRDLLWVRVGHVVNLGLKMLAKLEKAGRLDVEPTLRALLPVFELSSKGAAKKAVRLIHRLAGTHPATIDTALQAAIHAIRHSSADVQEAALEVLEYHRDQLSPDRFDALAPLIPILSPSLQSRALALFPDDAGIDLPDDTAAPSEDTAWFDELWDRFSAIPPELASMASLSESNLLGQLPAPITWDLIDRPLLRTIDPITPIHTLEELIDEVAHAVEIVDRIDEVERILDGLSRLCDQKPSDFSVRTSSLLKRIQQPQTSEVIRGLVSGWGGVSMQLRDLLLTWLTGDFHDTANATFYRQAAPFLFINRRIKELKKRVHIGSAGVLLSAPTHEHGWIDPRTFVDRLEELDEHWTYSHREDVMQGLLRLAPDYRAEALEKAAPLHGLPGRLTRWALGSPEGPDSPDKRDYDLWIAAGRARSPRESLRQAYEAISMEDPHPDSLEPASFFWTSTLRTSKPYNGKEYHFPNIVFSSVEQSAVDEEGGRPQESAPETPGIAQVASRLFSSLKRITSLQAHPTWRRIPTAAMHQKTRHAWNTPDLCGAWLIHWLSFVWPLHTDSCLVIGIQNMILRHDENAASYSPNYAYLEPAFHTYRPWTEMTCLAVWVGLSAKDSDLQGHAIDALITAIEDGRAHPEPMAEVLIELARGGWLKTNRLAHALEQVSLASPSYTYFVATVLDRFIGSVDELPNNLHHLLGLLLEVHAALGMAVSERATSRLATITGKGKAAKLAGKLCELKPAGDLTAVFAEAVDKRLVRLECWAHDRT